MVLCQECGKEYELNDKWAFILCPKCAKQKTEGWVKIWFSEILGYNEAIVDFIPLIAVDSFKSVIKEAKRKYHIEAESHSCQKSNQDFIKIAEDAKNDLIMNGIPSESRICKVCNKKYDADAVWPYIICKNCAEDKISKHKEFFITEVYDYDEEYIDFLPVPKINVNEFLISKEKVDRDNRSNQLNPNSEEYKLSRKK